MEEIEKLESLANEHGHTIYNILHRNAGWGIQWATKQGAEYKDGLVVYFYRPTLAEAVADEIKRIREGSE